MNKLHSGTPNEQNSSEGVWQVLMEIICYILAQTVIWKVNRWKVKNRNEPESHNITHFTQ